ncbi:MAG: hypothetical protein J6S45_04525 [Firmicutes bacterium]|nr:hypothetical protein [Bacillota bacterium]
MDWGILLVEIERSQKNRLLVIFVGIVILMMALALRLYQIQVRDGAMYETMARSQQKVMVSGVDRRGEICDRHGEALTGSTWEYVYLLRKDRMDDGAMSLLQQIHGQERFTSNEKYRIFSTGTYVKEASEELRKRYGAYIIEMPQRYQENQVAKYLIGSIDEVTGQGTAGLELAFDDWLSQRDTVIYGIADAANRILPGYGIQNKEERMCRLITTIDKPLQERLEAVVERKDTVVITDVKSGDILALTGERTIDEDLQLNTIPLQIARWTSTLAKDGMDTGLHVALSLEDDEGSYPLGRNPEKRVLSMEAVKENRKTFGQFDMLQDWDYLGRIIVSEEGTWLTAMVPAQEPRFTVTVSVSKKDPEGNEALRLFETILENLESSEVGLDHTFS